tara:strand:+ start:674 stop:1324 length:651 start_codon:yes stop_codon:yes gene_type:complete
LHQIIKVFISNSKYWIFLFFFQFVYGVDDTESWSSVGFQTKLPYSLKLDLEQELRFKDQVTSFKQTFTEVSVSYPISNRMKLFIPFRYSFYKDKNKQRISLGGSYRQNFKPISIKYRIKLQRTYENRDFADNIIRNKFTVDYKINKKMKPYISSEFFFLDKLDKYQYDEYRLSFGFNINLPRKKVLKIFYTYKFEGIITSDSEQTDIFGFAYHFKW